MKKKLNTKLPDKPSEILIQALTDLEYIAKNKRFSINMGAWMRVNRNSDKCEVCLAGATLARTCNFSTKLFENPDKLKVDHSFWNDSQWERAEIYANELAIGVENKLRTKIIFINSMRAGCFTGGFKDLRDKELITDDQCIDAIESFEESDGHEDYEDERNIDYVSDKESFINHMCAVIGTLQSIGL
jgi:hypothetical protein